MPSTHTSSTRAANSARSQIIALLKDDHKRVKKAFKDFEKLDPADDAESCQALVRQACGELLVHAAIEEELFYPTARETLEEADLIDEAEVEHMSAKMLIEQLQGMDVSDDKYAATFKVLGEYVMHHVKEEESEMFKQLGRAKADWETVWADMQTRRMALMKEYLPEMAEELEASGEEDDETQEDEAGDVAGKTGSGKRSASKTAVRGKPSAGASSSSRGGGRTGESRAMAKDDDLADE